MTSPVKPEKEEKKLPDSIRLFVTVWLVALFGEAIHQILNVVISLQDMARLRHTVEQTMRESGTHFPSSLIDAAVIGSISFAGLFGLAVVALLAWMAHVVKVRHKWSATGRRLLLIFGFYFLFRLIMVFTASSAGLSTVVPIAWYAVDGAVQVAVGVAATLALIFGLRQESADWVVDAEEERRQRWSKQ